MRTFSDILRVMAMVLLGYLTFGVQSSNAQVQLPPYYKPQFLDQNGRPLSNGCVFTYISGTNTPQATFTDFTGGTPNPNPIQLDGSGRPPLGTDIWLGSGSYRFKLVSQGGTSCNTGIQQWLEDGITSSTGTILASNNTFTGTNTFDGPTVFNGAVTMNVGFTSNGPSNLTAGGSLVGTFSGSPTLTGTWNFQGEVDAVNIVYSGELFSTIATGTPPMTVVSTTQVPNFNASLLEGCTWESPCAIGGVTPNTAHFTDIVDTGAFTLGGSNVSSIKGLDTALYTAGTIAGGAGHTLCTDTNGSATTSGCPTSGFTSVATGTNGAVCTTATGNGSTCNTTVTITPTQADTSYVASCSGNTPTGYPFIINVSPASTSAVTVTLTNGASAQAVASTYNSLNCIVVHP
jgi:hypothetical protein